MYCSNCKKKIEDDALYCPECGTIVNNSSSSETLLNGQKIEKDSCFSNNSAFSNDNNIYKNDKVKGENHPEFTLWLVMSIVNLICCCRITGVAALILVILGNNAYIAGNVEEANQKINIAKILSIVGLIIGFLISIIYMIYTFFTVSSVINI